MTKTNTYSRRAPSGAAIIHDLLHSVPQNDDTAGDLKRLMQILGYAVSMTPAGFPAFQRVAEYKGKPATIWVMTRNEHACPTSLMTPVFVGFYSMEPPVEMLSSKEYPHLLEYLREHHSSALGASQDTTGAGN